MVVMDNAPYDSMLLDKLPTFSSKMCEMQQWLVKNTDKFNEKRTLGNNKRFRHSNNKTYVVNEHVREHEVFRLAPYYCRSNPIELAWYVMKDYHNKHINRKNVLLRSIVKIYDLGTFLKLLSKHEKILVGIVKIW